MESNLKKTLSIPQVIALASGGMVAAWMVEIKDWFSWSGTGSLLALLFCGILVLPLCFIYSEMTAMLPYAGGENIWVSNAFGWDLGWLECLFTILMYVMAMPTVSMGISSMLIYLYDGITTAQLQLLAVVILAIWYILSNFELKILSKIQSWLFWGTLIVSLSADLIFIFSGQWSFANLKPWFPNGAPGFGLAVALMIMKFIGFDMIPQLAEECDFPKKKMWIAFLGSILATVAIYGTAIFAVGGIVSNEWIAEVDIVDPNVADLLNMHWLAVVIVIMGALTCLTTLTGFWASASRTFLGAAEQRQFTPVLGKINKHGQPWVANIVVLVLSVFFTCLAPESWVNYIYTIYGFTAGIVYLLVCLSFLKLRKSKPQWERPFVLKGGIFWGCFGIVFCLYVIYQSATSLDTGAITALAIYLALGVIFWVYAKIMQKKKPELWSKTIIGPKQ